MIEKFLYLLMQFCFVYPIFMSWVWISGSIFYWLRYEKKFSNPKYPPKLSHYPRVALIVPCYNEDDNVEETILNLLEHSYPNFEVIAVNDGSDDKTGQILDELAQKYEKLRVIHQSKNEGKAVALTTAALLTDAEFLLCIDGDSLLDHNASYWFIRHFIESGRVGAVTGNPRIRTRSSLLGAIQVAEFSSIIGLIKRAQRTYGRLFTVSGVCVMFRKTALCDVGFWSNESLTEDIDISWKLQIRHWDIRFEPAATCWILMPETIKGLWQQRLRWSIGGVQAILKYGSIWAEWKSRRMWIIFIEYCMSLIWSYSMITVFMLYFLHFFTTLPSGINIDSFLPEWAGLFIAITSMIHLAVATWIDSRYDYQIWRNYLFAIWYPIAFWMLNMLTAAVAFPMALYRKNKQRGLWSSPDRGLQR